MNMLEESERLLKGWTVEILATDLNDRSIETAKAGIYGDYALRSTTDVSVEKVPQLMLVAGRRSGYKQARVLDAAVHDSIWRLAAHDGTPIPLGVAVLLLPSRRSSS
jgi:hypothetical protein